MAEWKKVVVSGSSAELAGLTVDNTIVGSIDGNAATVTTNANLSGDVTSAGNVTTIANDAVETAMISDANVTNAKLANDGLMIGSTEISLGATGSSLAGLTNVTATGRIAAANLGVDDGSSTITGSFAGDGSALTGLPDATDAKFLVYTTGSGTNSIVGATDGSNVASGACSVVAGGCSNNATSQFTTVGGGKGSTASAYASTVGGGMENFATGEYSAIIGGSGNNATALYATIGGGTYNGACEDRSTVSGGYNNKVEGAGDSGTISGGYQNSICGAKGFIGGGQNNQIANSVNCATIGGGKDNCLQAAFSSILGGEDNCISSTGTCSGILGGTDNTVATAKSFIVGSNISSTVACHTHVNNLSTVGNITGSNICGTGRVQGATMGVDDGSSTITGSFVGDGSSLTGLPAAAIETYTGGTDNRIITAVNGTSVQGEGNLTFDGSILTVTGDATISQDLTISRNLIVQGTASFQSTEDLDIKDRFIRMASGSTSAGDGGIVIQQTSATNGEVFGFDSTATRFGLSGSFDASQNVFTPDAFLSAVVVGATGETKDDVVSRYVKPGNIFADDQGEVYIYAQ